MPPRRISIFLRVSAPIVFWSTSTLAFAQSAEYQDATFATIFIVLALGFFLPTLIAFIRRHPNRWPILAVNVAFGATGLGWFATLLWSFHAIHKSPTGNHGGESGLNIIVNDFAAPTAHLPNLPPVSDDIGRLTRLLEEGAITGSEYEALRRSVTSRFDGPSAA